MDKILRATMLDNILKKFNGNVSAHAGDQMHSKEWHGTINENYFVVENLLNQLYADEMLIKKSDDWVSLTPKGFATMTDLENLGYVTKEKERQKIETREKRTLFWAIVATILTGVSIAIDIFSKPD